MLAPIFTAASASILVIALRMATILADVFCFGAGWLLLPKRKHISAKTA
jgi:membrane protein YqaA with SNARE-associated domain